MRHKIAKNFTGHFLLYVMEYFGILASTFISPPEIFRIVVIFNFSLAQITDVIFVVSFTVN